MAHALPPDSPPQAGWTEGKSTDAQASKLGVQHRAYGPDAYGSAQIDATLPDEAMGHCVMSTVLEDQTDTANIEDCHDMPMSFRRTSILQEKLAGGYTPNTAPVGEGQPTPTPTPGGRNLADTEALIRLRMGQE